MVKNNLLINDSELMKYWVYDRLKGILYNTGNIANTLK